MLCKVIVGLWLAGRVKCWSGLGHDTWPQTEGVWMRSRNLPGFQTNYQTGQILDSNLTLQQQWLPVIDKSSTWENLIARYIKSIRTKLKAWVQVHFTSACWHCVKNIFCLRLVLWVGWIMKVTWHRSWKSVQGSCSLCWDWNWSNTKPQPSKKQFCLFMCLCVTSRLKRCATKLHPVWYEVKSLKCPLSFDFLSNAVTWFFFSAFYCTWMLFW